MSSRRKIRAGQTDLSGELSEGAALLREAAARASGEDRALLSAASGLLENRGRSPRSSGGPARSTPRCWPRANATRTALAQPGSWIRTPIDVDRLRARFGSWYELFPRSWGGLARHRRAAPRLASLGFDVVYLPPIHPIGRTLRKGRNNALVAAPGDPGSPWAIGSEEGGHTAVHPDLGTLEDFDDLVSSRARAGIGDRARLRDPMLRRPPVAARASRMVSPPPRRNAEVCGEPAQALPGHLQRQLRVRGLAWTVGGLEGGG